MATAPTAELTVDDAVDILKELLPVQNQSFLLGLNLKLPYNEVDGIRQQYKDPKDRLLQTIIAFLKRTEPKPTWRVIVDALKNATLGLPALGKKLEAAHFPANTTKAQDETTDTESAAKATAGYEDKLSPPSSPQQGAELTRAEETIRREQQQIQEMRQRKAEWESSTTEMESSFMEMEKLIVDSEESGALILGQQSFVYDGKKLDFVWNEGGISVHFPAAASSKTNIIEISVAVVGDVQKHSVLPMPYQLMTEASATYKITASAPLPVAVKVRMQHCVVLESGESLTLMVADRGPPYYFKPLPGAIFPPESSYGEIEVQSFSFFQLLKDMLSRRRHPMRLSIQVFYHEDSTATFVVTKNIPTHLVAAKKSIHTQYIHSEDMSMTCDNSIEAITLSVPVDSNNGWHVSSRFKPAKIKLFDIDMYEPRQTCPKIILCMEWKGSGRPTKESVCVPIQGGSIESYDLLCRPPPQKQDNSSQAQTLASSATTESPANLSDPPTLPLLQTFPKRSGGVIKIIEEVTGKNHDLGIRLLDDDNGTITNNIEYEHRHHHPTRITKAIFHKWLQGTGKSPQSWATLLIVLKEIDHTTLAKEICGSITS